MSEKRDNETGRNFYTNLGLRHGLGANSQLDAKGRRADTIKAYSTNNTAARLTHAH